MWPTACPRGPFEVNTGYLPRFAQHIIQPVSHYYASLILKIMGPDCDYNYAKYEVSIGPLVLEL
jgi:hypothetical protein